ncbi:MAG: histidinol-phosphatase [Verrucomicrobiota bacterium JB023]|nr:histidinol-phosphatase [Verrucomicrobiota bacterium JB023]
MKLHPNADLHTHTPLCQHAEGTPAEYVAAAVAARLEVYGISDHAPHLPEPFDDWRMTVDQLPEYDDWIAEARAHAPDNLTILAALECDWLPGARGHLEWLRTCRDWDYLIGSIHYLPRPITGARWDFDNPAHLSVWNSLGDSDLNDLWTLYWKEYEAMVRSDLFEIHGHPDLIKKFSPGPSGDLKRFYLPVIEALAETGKAIELNTAGWHKPCAEQYPAEEFLQLAAEARIPLTINSDAHHPSEIARDFEKARGVARRAGFPIS